MLKKAEQEAIARAVERNARRQTRVAQGGNGTDEESDQEEERKRAAAQAVVDAPIPEQDGQLTAAEKAKARAYGDDAEMDAASSSSEEEQGVESGGTAEEKTGRELRPKKAQAQVGWLGPAKPRFDHNPNQLVGIDGGMRMTALCREPVRSHCYRGADHTGYYLFPGETFEFITMQTDEQGTKRLKIKTRSGKTGWIRAQAGHTRPRYRVVQDRIKVRASHEKHSDKVGRLEKGMIITCEESIQVGLTRLSN